MQRSLSDRPSVLVTGASGFIGSRTVQEFSDRGWTVFAMAHRRPIPAEKQAAWSDSVHVVQGDIGDRRSLEAAFATCKAKMGGSEEIWLDAVVHCAGRASDVGHRRAFRRANYDSVRHLGELVMEHEVPRFVFISTTDVYGLRDFHGETEEELDYDPRPWNPYPGYKIQAEKWIKNHMPSWQYSILRPAAVWAKDDPTMTRRVRDFLAVSPLIVHFGKWKGTNRWPKVHVDRVAQASVQAATLPEAAGEAFNLLDPDWISVEEFYRLVIQMYFPEKRRRSVTIPFWLGYPFAKLVNVISNTLNLYSPICDPSLYALYTVSRNLDFSGQKAERLLFD